jgi:NitT/TauT family transport system substrate-binding protein
MQFVKASSKLKLFTVMVVAMGLVLAACGGGSDDNSAPKDSQPAETTAPKQLGSVVVASGADPGYAVFVVAVKEGFFKNHGIDASLRVFPGAPQVMEATLAGDADMGATSEQLPILSKAQGADIHVVSTLQSSDKTIGLVAKKEITKPKDLEGKKVGIVTATASDYFAYRYFAIHGIDKSKVTLQNIAANNMVPVFQRGDIDAFFLWSPNPETAMQTVPGSHVLAWNGQDKAYSLTIFTFFGKKLYENKPMAQAAVAALIDAEKFIVKNQAKTIEHLVSALQLDPANAKTALEPYTMKVALTEENRESMKNVAEWLKVNNRLTTEVDWSTWFSPEFLKKVDPSRVTLK